VDGRHGRCRWPSMRPGLRWAMFKTTAGCGESLLPAIPLLCTTLVCLAQQPPLRSVSPRTHGDPSCCYISEIHDS
jgi:hypothetical protein